MLEDTTLHSGVAAKPDTSRLIGLSKVEGATVYNSRGDFRWVDL